MEKVYKLLHDEGHSGDSLKDGFLLKYEGWNTLSYQLIDPKTPINKLPSTIYFQANFNVIPEFDYPTTDVGISVMSQRMFHLISDLKKHFYESIPVVMLDDTYLGGLQTLEGEIKEDVSRIDSYLVLKENEFQNDVFDYDNSEFKMSRRIEGQIGRIKKICLKEPSNGFAPIFRISETPSTLFVSEKTKETLESNDIKGCVFEEVEVTPFAS